MKHTFLAVGLMIALANTASAQITEIHSRCTENGGHITIAEDTQVFNYEATISGTSVAFIATLEVYHNGILKASSVQAVLFPPPSYLFTAPVNMANWGLHAGDQVTFRLKVVKLGSGNLLGTHTMTGDVTPAGTGSATQ